MWWFFPFGRQAVLVAGLIACSFVSMAPAQQPVASGQALLARYCVGCHSEQAKTGGIVLANVNPDKPGENAQVLEKVLRKVRTGEMPPRGLPRPEPAVTKAFTASLEATLDQAVAKNPNPGRPAIHRLNRVEYSNAIRDLLAIDLNPGSSLPPDDSGYGFDNIGDVLSVSPILLERYISLARKISRLAVGDPGILPAVEEYSVPVGLSQADSVSDDLPLGSRGGIAIQHAFPLDAEYTIRIRVRGFNNRARDLVQHLDLRLDDVKLKEFEILGKSTEADEASPTFEVRVPVKAGVRMVGVNFLSEHALQEGALPPPPAKATPPPRNLPGRVGVDSVLIGGPFEATGSGDTPSRQRIFVCRPANSKDEPPCAKKIFSTLARRAYRRPVTDADLKPLLSFFETGRHGGTFESGIESGLRRMLVAPDFLFRVERDPAAAAPGSNYRLNDFELASRLSFFLWSSIPDDQLLDLADREKLQDPAVFEQQVRRMLADHRSRTLVSNFAGQWLYLRNLSRVQPDPDVFPEFDENLREAFQRETELLLEDIVREDRSVVDLLNANFTFLNERLARHYQIADVHGSNFRRVSLTDSDRFGLLGQGSILTVTSYPTRTSPVLRGKWILENLLGTPPPPPPANVPDLKDHAEDGRALSLREQMEKHRADSTCASCHARMDPLGFALENYDGVGKRRTKDADGAIDTSGSLPNGTKFQGPAGLRDLLLSRRDEFVETFAEKLLTYALGRGLEYYDQPAVRAITRTAAKDDYRVSSVIVAITKSTPFQMRRAQDQ
jgi:cytochrome c553